MFDQSHLFKLHQKAKWDDEKQDWQIPLFTFNPKGKDISFPSINAKQRVDQMKDERELHIQEDGASVDHSEFRKNGNFSGVKKDKRNENTSASNSQENDRHSIDFSPKGQQERPVQQKHKVVKQPQ